MERGQAQRRSPEPLIPSASADVALTVSLPRAMRGKSGARAEATPAPEADAAPKGDRELAREAIERAWEIFDAEPDGITEYALIRRLESEGYVRRIAAAAVDSLGSSGRVRVSHWSSGTLTKP